jgi:ribose 5-phosphate isomerase B
VRIYIGADHAGYELKDQVKAMLAERGIEVVDVGTNGPGSVDYPDIAAPVARAVSSGEAPLGILICGTGIGMSMVANKFPKVRAGLVGDLVTARMCREHNDCNLLVLGARVVDPAIVGDIVGTWLDTLFAGDRHARRLDKIGRLEASIGETTCATS